MNGVIYGTPQKCTDQASYYVKIQVNDRWNNWYWRIYTFPAMYKSNIKAGGAQFDGEMNLYIDGNIAGHLKSGQDVTQYFCYGNSHQISVDYEVVFPTDNSTKYKTVNRFTTVSNYSPDAEFIFYREYLINNVTDPPEVSELPQYWSPNATWYKEGDLIKKDALLEIEDGKGTQYIFTHWLLPTSDEIDTNRLSWQLTRPGEIVACYKTKYLLDTNTPFIAIDGLGWKAKYSLAKWRVTYPGSKLSDDIGAWLGIYLIPDPAYGQEYMDKPKILTFNWLPECRPAAGAIIIALIIALIPYLISHFANKNHRDKS